MRLCGADLFFLIGALTAAFAALPKYDWGGGAQARGMGDSGKDQNQNSGGG